MRRKSTRYVITHPVELRVAADRREVMLHDVSRTGLFACTDAPWSAGTEVRIALPSDTGRRLHTRGTVARRVTTLEAQTVGGIAGVGVALREPSEPADELFGLGIEHLVRRSVREVGELALRGQLSNIGLATVLTMLEVERKSGRLELEDSGRSIWIELVEGRIVDAGTPELELDIEDAWAVLMHALDWRRGTFEL